MVALYTLAVGTGLVLGMHTQWSKDNFSAVLNIKNCWTPI